MVKPLDIYYSSIRKRLKQGKVLSTFINNRSETSELLKQLSVQVHRAHVEKTVCKLGANQNVV